MLIEEIGTAVTRRSLESFNNNEIIDIKTNMIYKFKLPQYQPLNVVVKEVEEKKI